MYQYLIAVSICLYIVDGFQMENGLQNVDINDIETIDVMKDASATAIYGARGFEIAAFTGSISCMAHG